MQNIIYVKNIHKAGKAVFESKFGAVDLEVRLIKGSKIYEIFVERKSKHVTRVDPESSWNWIGEYLGCVVHEESPRQPPPKEKKK